MANRINTKEAQAKNYVLPIVPDAARARVEIEELLADNDMTNLYLLAMEAMQQEHSENSVVNGNEDWWTFYSLAGRLTSSLCITFSSDHTSYSWSTVRAVERYRKQELFYPSRWLLHSWRVGVSDVAQSLHGHV